MKQIQKEDKYLQLFNEMRSLQDTAEDYARFTERMKGLEPDKTSIILYAIFAYAMGVFIGWCIA